MTPGSETVRQPPRSRSACRAGHTALPKTVVRRFGSWRDAYLGRDDRARVTGGRSTYDCLGMLRIRCGPRLTGWISATAT
jgi:hypothetical protein